MWPRVFGHKHSMQRRTREASYAYRGPLLALCTYTQPYQPHNTTRTVQRALVTVTSSGTTFLTLARARSTRSRCTVLLPLLSLFLPSPSASYRHSPLFRSSRSPGLRLEKDTNDARVRARHTDFWSRAKQTKRGRANITVVRMRSININDSLCPTGRLVFPVYIFLRLACTPRLTRFF